ncbi:MSW1 [Candida oxycetoniae]|uniref:Tryptophan--tRNA ligase, mitochondrial n=1 Tax=Candida oxycetoniae TaxID=497107 RepID=A0AAI9WX08_9ASCO|nr:MSW1 [Candida oxycetoniae]KAI3403265.2 MSW1 [Candida oxycetoniae]
MANDEYVTDSSSDFTEYWIDSFLGIKGNEYFCDIDDEYIRDRFNLTGLNQEVTKLPTLIDIITDVIDIDSQPEEHREVLEHNARILYGLIHARYILTTRGLNKMFEKFRNGDFGYCPRVHCQLNPLLPIGLNDQPRMASVKLYCSKCEDLYNPKSGRHSVIDGAYFGTSFPAMFFQNFPNMIPVHSKDTYVPRVFGFKLHEYSKLNRWRELQRLKLERRLMKNGIQTNNVVGGFIMDNPNGATNSSYADEQRNLRSMLSRRIVAITRNARYITTTTTTTQKVPSVQQVGVYETLPSHSRVFSMIQPTGRIHLGNYLGAVKSWRTLSDTNPDSEFIFGIADLHAFTVQKPASQLKEFRHQAIASLLSCGLDISKCVLYFQSAIPEHSELNWYLTCLTSMGQLNRMSQWKSKAQQSQNSTILDDTVIEATKAGLFCYPVLQAADVLLYKSTHVPVGDDQTQHLELCRNIARAFNSFYQVDFFPIPKTLLTPAKKILSLKNPEKKMSKSDPVQAGCVYVTDTPDEIFRKVRKATTDSIQGPWNFDPVSRPGVSNLISIVSGLTDKSIEETVASLQVLKDHKALKDYVSNLIIDEFKEKRQLYDELLNDKAYLDKVCNKGRDNAKEMAQKNIQQIKQIIGMD